MSPFRGQESSGLLTTPVYRYVRLQLHDNSRANVALAFLNGDPMIVEEAIHRGRSIVVATSADVSWTTMPMWSSYVPIVQELLALAVSGQVEQRNVEVGQPLGSILRALSADAEVAIHKPDGEQEAARLMNDGDFIQWTFGDTFESGIYTASLSLPSSRSEHFAVNVSPSESDLTPIDAADLQNQIWQGVRFEHRTTWQDLNHDIGGEISRRGKLHRWLLLGVMGLLLGETLLAWRFGYHRR